jgi:hypothetical protein
MSHTDPTPGAVLSDRVVSLLRTAVPSLWGSLVAWAAVALTGYLPEPVQAAVIDALSSEYTIAVVMAAAITGWYAAWRWMEPRLPAWLVRIALGSAQTPTYAGTHEA